MQHLRRVDARGVAPRTLTRGAGSFVPVLLVVATVLTACGESSASATPQASPTMSAPTPEPTPRPTPTPTPPPSPQFTNPADPALAAMIPAEVAGAAIQVPPVDEFAYTPGDFGEAYGELGLRFTALQVAYVPRPRSLSLFIAQVSPPAVTTAELEPYLATAGQYVGINGLHRDPWKLETMDGRVVWVRPEDNATALNTMIYTWASGEYVFLMIGLDDALNRGLFAALPGEAAPTPTPKPSRSPASASPATEASAAPS